MRIIANDKEGNLVRVAYACYLYDAYANPDDNTMQLCLNSAFKADVERIRTLLGHIGCITIHVTREEDQVKKQEIPILKQKI